MMLIQVLIATLCVLPLASSFYIGHDFDTPDQKVLRRNAFGQVQAFDVSHERRLVSNGYGGLSQINVVEYSDPDTYHPVGPAIFPHPIGLPNRPVYPGPMPLPYHPGVPFPPRYYLH
ncbi:unnamed protein product [Lymnaea stagnalis]|uniref:Uncharacterized protein n=1 Tax=Lymnaea stagnalis TaxID=6523 RepID=A0AAV2H641_LYMST